jgi:hypothetical protein
MKSKEYSNFENALGRVLRVSHEELKRRIEAEKRTHANQQKRGPKPKNVSGHASGDKD